MRVFARPTPLHRLSLQARWIYSAFCAFMLVGYGTSAWFYVDDKLGTTGATARGYYLGDAEPPPTATQDPGPALTLPADFAAPPLHLAKPTRQIMETFHFHVFSMAVCLLVIAHIFMMCAWPSWSKSVVVISGFISTALHVATPPLTALASPTFAVLMFPSALGMVFTWSLMTLWPLWEMWRSRPA